MNVKVLDEIASGFAPCACIRTIADFSNLPNTGTEQAIDALSRLGNHLNQAIDFINHKIYGIGNYASHCAKCTSQGITQAIGVERPSFLLIVQLLEL